MSEKKVSSDELRELLAMLEPDAETGWILLSGGACKRQGENAIKAFRELLGQREEETRDRMAQYTYVDDEQWAALCEREGVLFEPMQAFPQHGNSTWNGVLEYVERHKNTWKDTSPDYWLARLMAEVGELASTVAGDHEGPIEHELRQIASICINWLGRHLQTSEYGEAKKCQND